MWLKTHPKSSSVRLNGKWRMKLQTVREGSWGFGKRSGWKKQRRSWKEKGFGQRGRHLEGMRWIWKEREGVTDDEWKVWVVDREGERVKCRRDGLSYFQMAWSSGNDTFTERSHSISHWLHLPALPCCSLVKPATDQWFMHTHPHTVYTFSFILSLSEAIPQSPPATIGQ